MTVVELVHEHTIASLFAWCWMWLCIAVAAGLGRGWSSDAEDDAP